MFGIKIISEKEYQNLVAWKERYRQWALDLYYENFKLENRELTLEERAKKLDEDNERLLLEILALDEENTRNEQYIKDREPLFSKVDELCELGDKIAELEMENALLRAKFK